MILRKLKIENFRSIKISNISLSNSTLLVGANDQGKTNILKAIDLVFNLNIDLKTISTDPAIYKTNKRSGSGSSPLRISILIDELPSGMRHTNKKLTSIGLSLQITAQGKIITSFCSSDLNNPKKKHSSKALKKIMEIREKFNVKYVPTFRDIEEETKANEVDSYLFELISLHLQKSISRKQGGTTNEYRSIAKTKKVIQEMVAESFQDIKTNVTKYLPESFKKSGGGIDFGFIHNDSMEVQDKLLSDAISKLIYIKNDNSSNSLNDLGSGIKQAVTIGLIEKSILHHSKTNLILFEEPESFLHPSAQRELYSKLQKISFKPNNQVVFTSHSHAILDATDLKSIILVKKFKDQETKISHTRAMQLRDLEKSSTQKILEDLEIQRTFQNSEVFFSDFIVFVEGYSDELVLKEAFRILDPSLLHRVSIVNCGGNTKFSTMINFLMAFKTEDNLKLKWLIITDKDTWKNSESKKDLLKICPDLKITDIEKVMSFRTAIEAGVLNKSGAHMIGNRLRKLSFTENIFCFDADLEYALVNPNSLAMIKDLIKSFHPNGNRVLTNHNNCDEVARLIGSRGPNMDWGQSDDLRRSYKRPTLHRLIASRLKKDHFNDDIKKLILLIQSQIDNQ